MRCVLWPEGPEAEHWEEIEEFFANPAPARPAAVLVAEDADGSLVGFVELAIRPYAEGCLTDRVAYLEGWYVAEPRRGTGVGRALVGASEDWGRAQGCSEFASDADPDNGPSISAHTALGFTDAGMIRCFYKRL
jgi:aminoglycoside 6'-N-acetyltransferase I